MPGFGSGRFGRERFGHFQWSRAVLYDLLPSIYKSEDAKQPGQPLETWTNSLRFSFDSLLNRIGNWTDLRDPLRVRTQYNEVVTVRLGAIRTPETPIEQRGVDGAIGADRAFSSPTARFRAEDVGKTLILANSVVPINNRSFKIASLVSTTSVHCDPPLVVDPGPIRWQVKAHPVLSDGVMEIETRGGDVANIAPGWTLFDGHSQFEVVARQQFFPLDSQTKKLTQREGSQGVVLLDGRAQIEVSLTQQDVGKAFTLAGSALDLNNGKFQIYFVDPSTPSIVQLHAPLTLAGEDANGGIVYGLQLGVGNVRIRHLEEGNNTPLSVVVNDFDITVNLQTNASGVTLSTAAQIVAAITAFAPASALVTATVTGTGASLAGIYDFTPIPGVRLSPDAGPLTWALLPFPHLQLYAASPPAGIVEQEGVDLQITAPSTITSVAARFSDADIGKRLVVRGSSLGQDGFYPILTVTGINTATLDVTAPLVNESNLTWEVRTKSAIGDLTEVQLNASSLIEPLAQDFGIDIDQHETEARQRSWVENVAQWIDLKGLAKSYQIVGTISGFNVIVSALYRISTLIASSLPVGDVYTVGEHTVGRYGTDGALTLNVGRLRFASATAKFKAADVGVSLKIQNCTNLANEGKVFTIGAFIDAHTVEFAASDTAITPDYGVAGSAIAPTIQWDLVRLYTDLPPSRPLFDDVNPELMQSIVGANGFRLDQYCWDANFVNNFQVDITSFSPAASNGVPTTFTLTVSGVVLGPVTTSCGVVGAVGRWSIKDAAGSVFYLETVPVQIAAGPPPVHTFQVVSSAIPAVGLATLIYNCEPQDSCDYCRSSKVLIILEEGTILNEHGIHVEKVLERVLAREEVEPKPAHVELIPIFRRGINASLSLTVTIEADIEIYAVILAPLVPLFDILAGDIIPADL